MPILEGGCQCGAIRSEVAGAPLRLSVKPGTLDDTSWLIPDLQIWTRSKQPWVITPEGIEVYETQPTRRHHRAMTSITAGPAVVTEFALSS